MAIALPPGLDAAIRQRAYGQPTIEDLLNMPPEQSGLRFNDSPPPFDFGGMPMSQAQPISSASEEAAALLAELAEMRAASAAQQQQRAGQQQGRAMDAYRGALNPSGVQAPNPAQEPLRGGDQWRAHIAGGADADEIMRRSFAPIVSGEDTRAPSAGLLAAVDEILNRPTRQTGITAAYGPTVTGNMPYDQFDARERAATQQRQQGEMARNKIVHKGTQAPMSNAEEERLAGKKAEYRQREAERKITQAPQVAAYLQKEREKTAKRHEADRLRSQGVPAIVADIMARVGAKGLEDVPDEALPFLGQTGRQIHGMRAAKADRALEDRRVAAAEGDVEVGRKALENKIEGEKRTAQKEAFDGAMTGMDPKKGRVRAARTSNQSDDTISREVKNAIAAALADAKGDAMKAFADLKGNYGLTVDEAANAIKEATGRDVIAELTARQRSKKSNTRPGGMPRMPTISDLIPDWLKTPDYDLQQRP